MSLKYKGEIVDIIVINVGGVLYKCILSLLELKIFKDEFLLWENKDSVIKVFKERF